MARKFRIVEDPPFFPDLHEGDLVVFVDEWASFTNAYIRVLGPDGKIYDLYPEYLEEIKP
jgi:hypothetical protein